MKKGAGGKNDMPGVRVHHPTNREIYGKTAKKPERDDLPIKGYPGQLRLKRQKGVQY